jgi:predicted GTPase
VVHKNNNDNEERQLEEQQAVVISEEPVDVLVMREPAGKSSAGAEG